MSAIIMETRDVSVHNCVEAHSGSSCWGSRSATTASPGWSSMWEGSVDATMASWTSDVVSVDG